MAVLKLSQIAASGAGFTTGDFIVAVQGGTTDVLFSYAQLFAPPLVFTADATGAYSLLTLTGQTGVLAASQPVLNMTQTWNAAGVTFTGIKAVFTSTASAAGSNVLDIAVGATSVVLINKTGDFTIGGPASNSRVTIGPAETAIFVGGNKWWSLYSGQLYIAQTNKIGWNPNDSVTGLNDLFIGRGGAAATFQQGAADVAAPVAQITQVQSVVAGTASHVGADWTLKGSKGTGTTAGAGGKIIFQTAPVNSGTGATAQNATVAALTLTAPALGGNGGTVTQQPSVLVGNSALATTDTDGFLYIPTCAGAPTGTPTAFTGLIAMVYDTTNHQFWFYDGAAWLQPKTPAGAAVVTWQ